ncbi:MAG TPA: hypothetical protein VLJ21_04630 [Candidatus Binatia bacterium]|nr:hypothetical protein [Candidatus Binatia bacterium]
MADVFVNLLEDAEEELGLGKDIANLRKLGDELKQRMDVLANALVKLEKKGWTWTSGSKDLYLHKPSITDAVAKKELLDAGVPVELFHFI